MGKGRLNNGSAGAFQFLESLIQGNAAEKDETKTRELKGLYKNVNITVKTLDIIITCCIAVIVLIVIFNLM